MIPSALATHGRSSDPANDTHNPSAFVVGETNDTGSTLHDPIVINAPRLDELWEVVISVVSALFEVPVCFITNTRSILNTHGSESVRSSTTR
jgi:hypothetical protein